MVCTEIHVTIWRIDDGHQGGKIYTPIKSCLLKDLEKTLESSEFQWCKEKLIYLAIGLVPGRYIH